MSEVLISLGDKVETVSLQSAETVASLEFKLKQLFGIQSRSCIYGIREDASGRIFSLEDVITKPSIFSESAGSIILEGTWQVLL